MRKRSSNPVGEEGTVTPADPATEATLPPDAGKDPAAVSLGRRGGKKGGPARAKKLTKEQRSQIARKAAQARWAKKKSPPA